MNMFSKVFCSVVVDLILFLSLSCVINVYRVLLMWGMWDMVCLILIFS